MPRLTRWVILIGPIFAIFPFVIAIIYSQQPLRYEDVPTGTVLPEEYIDTSIPTLFSVADIHGDYPKALAALIHAGIVDENGDWKAGNATFVRDSANEHGQS